MFMLAISCLPVAEVSAQRNPEQSRKALEQLIVCRDAKIGFAGNEGKFNLYWRGDHGNTKNAEFRVGGGDEFFVARSSPNKPMFIGLIYDDKPLFLGLRQTNGVTRDAVFAPRNGHGPGSTPLLHMQRNDNGSVQFWFQEDNDRFYLFWRGDEGSTKNAEFRKGNKGDSFEISELPEFS